MNNDKKHSGRLPLASVLLCLLLSDGARADEVRRTFTNRQGRTMEAQLLDYEAADKTVVIKRPGAITGRAPLVWFSDADQSYILDWAATRRFREGLELLPELRFKAVSKKESGISEPGVKVFDIFYEIRFLNTTDVPFAPIDFEYCIFYNQGIRDDRTVNYEEGSCYGAGVVDRLDPTAGHVSSTRSIRLYTEGGSVGLFGTDILSLGNVRGIWLRFRTKLPSGREIEREYRTSDDELWEWSEYTFGAGMNEGAKKQTYYYVK